jgi:2,4-dienoyl-CoA reductase-like NADH-dependent reductase (Old Yellow Enzyme family)
MGYDNLLSPTQVADLPLKHRVVMSAMTRTRNDPITESPRELNVLYYTQRATDGGFLISEGLEHHQANKPLKW